MISPEARAHFRSCLSGSDSVAGVVTAALEHYGFDIQSLVELYGEVRPLTQGELIEVHESYCRVRRLPSPEHLLNARVTATTSKDGTVNCIIRGLAWHHKQERWHYFLRIEGGRNLSKRSEANEVEKC